MGWLVGHNNSLHHSAKSSGPVAGWTNPFQNMSPIKLRVISQGFRGENHVLKHHLVLPWLKPKVEVDWISIPPGSCIRMVGRRRLIGIHFGLERNCQEPRGQNTSKIYHLKKFGRKMLSTKFFSQNLSIHHFATSTPQKKEGEAEKTAPCFVVFRGCRMHLLLLQGCCKLWSWGFLKLWSHLLVVPTVLGWPEPPQVMGKTVGKWLYPPGN